MHPSLLYSIIQYQLWKVTLLASVKLAISLRLALSLILLISNLKELHAGLCHPKLKASLRSLRALRKNLAEN
jgi:hypothetical protein